MKPIVIREARAAGRLFVKEVAKAAGKDRVLDDAEKRSTYRDDKLVGKAIYRYQDAMHHHWWGGEGGISKYTVDLFQRAVNEGVKQLVAIDTNKKGGNSNGVVTQKEVESYARSKGELPLFAKTLVDFMVAAKKAGKLR